MTRVTQPVPGTVYINGKFLEHPITGTERYALEVTRQLLAAPAFPTVLLLPRGVRAPDGIDPRHCRTVPLSGMAFEQITLPWVTRGAMLLNLGGPAPLFKRRQLVVMHDATPFRGLGTFSWLFVAWYWLLYGVLTRTAQHLVTVSRFSAEELSEVLHVPAARFVVAPCAADHLTTLGDGTRPDGLPGDVTSYALILGTLAKHKNVLPVARAVAGTGIDLVVVGGLGKDSVFTAGPAAVHPAGQPDQPDQPAQPGQPAPSGSVHLIGRVSDESIVWLYRHALVFVVPSLYEGFGIPLIEAQLEGCPVISSNAAALPEVGADSVLYFDPRAPADAARLVRQVSGFDDRQRAATVTRSLQNAARFSWAATARQITDIVAGAKLDVHATTEG